MIQSRWLTIHPTLGIIGMAHILGSWVHLRAQVNKNWVAGFSILCGMGPLTGGQLL